MVYVTIIEPDLQAVRNWFTKAAVMRNNISKPSAGWQKSMTNNASQSEALFDIQFIFQHIQIIPHNISYVVKILRKRFCKETAEHCDVVNAQRKIAKRNFYASFSCWSEAADRSGKEKDPRKGSFWRSYAQIMLLYHVWSRSQILSNRTEILVYTV